MANVGSVDGVINANTWLSNILPSAQSSSNQINSTKSQSTTEDSSNASSGTAEGVAASAQNTQIQNIKKDEIGGGDSISTMHSPQKPVNLLPEVPSTTSRKLTDREQRDCEVIGKYIELLPTTTLNH